MPPAEFEAQRIAQSLGGRCASMTDSSLEARTAENCEKKRARRSCEELGVGLPNTHGLKHPRARDLGTGHSPPPHQDRRGSQVDVRLGVAVGLSVAQPTGRPSLAAHRTAMRCRMGQGVLPSQTNWFASCAPPPGLTKWAPLSPEQKLEQKMPWFCARASFPPSFSDRDRWCDRRSAPSRNSAESP